MMHNCYVIHLTTCTNLSNVNNETRRFINTYVFMFLFQFDLLGHYSSYSNNFPKAIRTISRCSRNSIEFEVFLQVSLRTAQLC